MVNKHISEKSVIPSVTLVSEDKKALKAPNFLNMKNQIEIIKKNTLDRKLTEEAWAT